MNSIYQRMLIAFLLLATFTPPALAHQTGSGITISRDQASLPDLFMEIHNQTGYFFYYNEKDLAGAHKVNIHVSHASLEAVLDLCFASQPIRYELDNHTIIVKAKLPEPPAPEPLPDIHGTVKDENGQPVAGATVTAGDRATSTDREGHFELHQIGIKANSIVISSVGYESQTIPVRGRVEFIIVLKKSVSKLDDVQVIAYGTTTRRLNTGDVSTVKGETIAQQPVSNPLAALEGRVPGLFITQQTGVPGGAFTVQLRGQNSIASGNNPLYIVDGVPFTGTSLASIYTSAVVSGGDPFSDIDPGNIESITILKDADATAIYGSRGANGVILITTKKGKGDKTRLTGSAYMGSEKITRKMKMLNTREYLQMRNEAFENDASAPSMSNGDYDLLTWDTTRYTDWERELIGGSAHQMDAQISVSGGNVNTQFLAGGGFHQEGTVFPGDFSDKKSSAHFSLNHLSLDSKFKMVINANYVVDNNNLPLQDFTAQSLVLAPDAPAVYDSAGKLNWPAGFLNPFSYLKKEYNAASNNLIANTVLSYKIFPELQFSTSLGYTSMGLNEMQISPLTSFNPSTHPVSGHTFFSNGEIKTWIIEPQLAYQRAFASGRLDLLVGMTLQEDARENETMYAYGFASDELLENIASASSITVYNKSFSQYKYNGFFGRIHYDWKDMFILNLTGRRDGSSRFGQGKQFANFGALGAAYIFSQAKWIRRNLPWLSFGKLRGSYGITGNDQIGDYQYYSTYAATPYPYQNVSGLLPNNLYNKDYSWETNRKLELAIELGFFNDRMLFSISCFNNRSSNQLVGYSLPAITGFSNVQGNLPAIVQNEGLEADLNATILKSKRFAWKASLMVTIPESKLIDYPNIKGSSYANIYEIGKSLQIAKLFHYQEVDPKTGVYSFEDVNKDGQITYPEDLTGFRKAAQQFYGGLQNSLQYKNWNLDFFFQFVKQTGYNYLSNYYTIPGMFGNQPSTVLQRWQKPGDKTSVQRFTQTYGDAGIAYFNNVSSDNIIGDASFIRLKNLSISYSFPHKGITKKIFEECRVFLLGQNLLTVTNYLGMDPENRSTSSLPPLKVVTAGIQFIL